MDSLFNRLKDSSYYYLYDVDFQDFLEMHLANLRKSSIEKSMEIEVDGVQRNRADRNFSLLCSIAGIPFHLHWVTLRINGYREYTAFQEKDTPLYHVDMDMLALLKLKFDESQTNN